MLAVSTFLLGIMTSAIAGAAGSTTRRATALPLEDSISQKTLSTFRSIHLRAGRADRHQDRATQSGGESC